MRKSIICILAAAAMVTVSCNTGKLDPLDNIYPEATTLSLTQLQKSESYKDEEGRRVFDLDLTDGTTPVHFTFIGSKYYLASGTYTQATKETAKDGNFVLETTKLGGKPVKQGSITVSKNDDAYMVYGVLFLEDGSIYKPSWKGTLTYVKEPIPAQAYTFTIADPAEVTDANSNVVAGVKSNVVTLNDFDGNFAAQFNLILSDGSKNIEGRYPVKEYASEDHTAGNGFDLGVYFGMDPGAYVIGSYAKINGELIIINPGDVVEVYVEDGCYVFETNSGLQMVAKPEEKDPSVWDTVDLGENVSLLGTEVDAEGKTVTVQFATNGLVKPFSKDSEGYYLNLVLYSKDGYLHAGSFTASDVVKEDAFLKGYDVFEPGVKMNRGTTLWKVSGTNAEVRNVVEGSVDVVRNDPEEEGGEVTWTFSMSTSQVVLNFTGAIPALTSEGVLISDVDPSQLTKVLSASSNLASGVPTLSFNFGTDDLSYSNYQVSGTGYRLSMDIYSPDGKLYEGTYTPCAVGGTVGEGEFGIGYDAEMWGMRFENWGTCWWTYDKKAEVYETVQKVLDGTVDVAYNPETKEFTIVLTSSVANTTFQGTIEGIEGVVEVDDYTGIRVDTLVSFTDNSASSQIVSLDFVSEGVTAAYDPNTWSTVYSGNGYRLTMDIYSADGTLQPGVYTACAVGGAVGEGEFGIGYDTEFWGMQMYNWGTCWWTVTDGAISAQKVLDGTVTVSKRGNVYTILIESTAVESARFKGELVVK